MSAATPRPLAARFATAALPALLAALCAVGCAGSRVIPVPEGVSPYDRIPDASVADFRAARERFLAGDMAQARARFERLLDAAPDIVPFGVWWQECEASLADPQTLRRRSEERATLRPGVGSEILAARAQTDRAAAETWLARAAERDPACVWVYYARAALAARDGRPDVSRVELEHALALDPGHMPSRRLEIDMLARDGSSDAARIRLTGWVARAGSDPRVLPADLAGARLDLALLALGAQDVDSAADQLEELDPRFLESWRYAAVRAVVAEEEGDLEAARRHIDEARALAPREILPAVQEALLFDDLERDPFRARAAWTVVRELAAESDELSSAFETLRARVRLERLDRAAADPAATKQP
jgi:Tfp pilus assembly protein PilF